MFETDNESTTVQKAITSWELAFPLYGNSLEFQVGFSRGYMLF
jgi:hypothetical protein